MNRSRLNIFAPSTLYVRIGIRQRTYDVQVSDRLGDQIHWQKCPCVVQQYRYLLSQMFFVRPPQRLMLT